MLENKHIFLIVTIKNRVDHFIQTFPSLITQYGIDYSLVFSDFASKDNFLVSLRDQIIERRKIFSPYLKGIRCISLLSDLKFNPRKAKNLGVSCCKEDMSILAFSDIDTFIGMDYLSYWCPKIDENKSFFVTRQQDSRASLPCRLKPEINYGNVIVYKSDFLTVNGWDESISYYGGDDDDLFHRLKLKGLREVNPISYLDAKQYSILHGDELRTIFMEEIEKKDPNESFDKIFSNNQFNKSTCDYLNPTESFKLEFFYERL